MPRLSFLPALAPATATATAAPTAAATATATATAAIARLVDIQGATVELGTIHLVRRGVRISSLGKRYEAESTTSAGITIRDHLGFEDLTVLLERCPQSVVVRTPAQSTNESFFDMSISVLGTAQAPICLVTARDTTQKTMRNNAAAPFV